MTTMKPLCFVLMPFGTKPAGDGGTIDFDAVYAQVIAPAVEEAGLEPLRADEEKTGGVIHKAMFERLILCEFAVADLTTANANVFYELGVRHAARKQTTVLMFAAGQRLPFDVNGLRGLPYTLTPDGKPAAPAVDAAKLQALLEAARAKQDTDSPLYQLVDDYPSVQHEKTDVFRDRVNYSREAKQRFAAARKVGLDALRAEQAALGPLGSVEGGVLIDLFLSYRDAKGWDDMVKFAKAMPEHLSQTVMVREQLALALNRSGRGDEAQTVLHELIDQRGPSSETCGILGRVYKDRWEAALEAGDTMTADGLLDQAIPVYLQGFESDWRDAYPGINAVTLMTLKSPPDPRRLALIPVVRYAVQRRIDRGRPDYWDHATLLELAVLEGEEQAGSEAANQALALHRAPWEAETTARNLRLVREARARRQESLPWADKIEQVLTAKAG